VFLLVPFAPSIVELFPGMYTGYMLVIALVPAAVFAFAGVALVMKAEWAYPVAIAASALALFQVPLGTVLGIYGLWTMLSHQSRGDFESYTQTPEKKDKGHWTAISS
jgi:predicted phage tail protein